MFSYGSKLAYSFVSPQRCTNIYLYRRSPAPGFLISGVLVISPGTIGSSDVVDDNIYDATFESQVVFDDSIALHYRAIIHDNVGCYWR